MTDSGGYGQQSGADDQRRLLSIFFWHSGEAGRTQFYKCSLNIHTWRISACHVPARTPRVTLYTDAALPTTTDQQYVPSYLKHQKADGSLWQRDVCHCDECGLYVDRSRQVFQGFKGLHMCTDTLASVNSPDKKLIHSVTKKKPRARLTAGSH